MTKLPIVKAEKATPEDYFNLFYQSPTGQKVLSDMLRAHHFYTSTFDADSNVTTFREGERNVVLRILTILDEHRKEKEK